MSRIDVVVPCYNYGCFLRECVESVLEQSHKDLRVLIIDDASSDDTPAVSAELAARDARIDVSRHPLNRGHIATYNEGIQRAQGDYLLLLSADDFLLPGALERAIAVLDARPEVGLVYGACMLHRPDDQTPRPIQYVTHAGVGLIDPATFIDVLAFGNCVNTATAVVRTSLQQQLGGYRTQLPHAGDLEMWLRFALRGRVVCIDTPQAVYRQHGRNMSRGYDEVADLHQVREAFKPHYRDIRERVPDGILLEQKIHRHFASRALRLAEVALRQRRVARFCRLLAVWLQEMLWIRMLALWRRARLVATRAS